MIVVHALLREGGSPALWAESAEVQAVDATAAKARGGGGTPHPFASSCDVLLRHLALPSDTAGRGTASLVLPSRGSLPEPSPGLPSDPVAARPRTGSKRLRAWRVDVVSPKTAHLAEVLREPAGHSASARYLLDVLGFAVDLVDRGRVLPSVSEDPVSPAARWEPVLIGADRAYFADLCEAMPPVCRAEQVGRRLDGGDASGILHGTLGALVDDLVRHRLAEAGAHHLRAGRHDATVAWWNALTGPPEFDAPAGAVRPLADRLRRWRADLQGRSAIRTCFRLRTPHQNGESDDWRLEILMQAMPHPGVLVPASQVWEDDRSVLHQWADYPHRQLLADLGRACALYPALSAGLRGPRPTGLSLDTAGAYDFLTHAESLEEAGFGVLLPRWWRRPARLSFRVSTTSTDASTAIEREPAVVLDEIVNCRWAIALGGEVLPESELAELARAQIPLVRVRGEWTVLDPERLAAGLAFLKGAGRGRVTAGELLLGVMSRQDATPLPIAQINGRGWLADLLSAGGGLDPIAAPAGLSAELRPYQRRGLAWLAFLDRLGLGACLADDPGLGKTVQLLALEALCRDGRERPPTLVVCPVSVVGNWKREAARFVPGLSVHIHYGPERLTGEALRRAAGQHDLVVTSYSTVSRDIDDLASIEWDRVVLDEAQVVKNRSTRLAQVVRRLPSRHRVALTGTPVENRLAELWSILDFTNPGLLGPATSFRSGFAVPIERYRDHDATVRLRQVTRPFLLRRVKTDPSVVPDLPEKIEMIQPCSLTVEQATLYRAITDDMLDRIRESEGIQRKGLVLAAISKLKQVCNHPAHLLGDESALAGRSGKLGRLEEIIEQALGSGDKVLCFTQFARFGAMLQRHLAATFGTDVLFLHGGMSGSARDAVVARSQAPDGPPVFLVSLKAGGTGLNLMAANHVVHLDRWWNPAVEDQATDRAYRIGQKRTVYVRKMMCIGTIEEKIHRLIQDKSHLAQWTIGVGDDWLTELTDEQLVELVRLSPEAVDE
ncbi:DEAD/DEAH box helicase [Microbispora hainanensis]|uniref:DEAD/DEAH box helicase n=1 Tax=Microbispora hainanensis TaxID=568844 RepID=UPI0033F65AD9